MDFGAEMDKSIPRAPITSLPHPDSSFYRKGSRVGDFNIAIMGMLIISCRGTSYRFWCHLWCSRWKASVFIKKIIA